MKSSYSSNIDLGTKCIDTKVTNMSFSSMFFFQTKKAYSNGKIESI